MLATTFHTRCHISEHALDHGQEFPSATLIQQFEKKGWRVYQIKSRIEVDETCVQRASIGLTFVDDSIEQEDIIDGTRVRLKSVLEWVAHWKTFFCKLKTIIKKGRQTIFP